MNGFRRLAPVETRQIQDLASVVEALDTRIVHAFDLLKALDARIVDVARTTIAAIDDERGSVGQLQADVANLKHDDLEHERVIVRLRPLAETTVLQRVSWLFTGRT